MKINVGCGRMVLDGWTNCDVQVSPKAPRPPEILCDAKKIPLPGESADVVMALHLLEHFYFWEVPSVLAEWRRLLKPGGKLILELPDLAKACRNLLEGKGDQWSMWPLYGDPGHEDPFMCHRWGYTPATLKAILVSNGFAKVHFCAPQTHGKRAQRDMRAEAIKA